MNNNQNINDSSSFGMLNNSTNQNITNDDNNTSNNTNQGNVVTLGEVSNVTYADTIGDINYGAPAVSNNENVAPSPENFINNDYSDTSISDLNVQGTYNNMNVAPDYTTDPKVMANLHPEEKNTVEIGKELKTFFILAMILLVFIFVMPFLFDLINSIRFN